MNKLSAVISAFNEEKKIEDCLKSVVHLAEEIIVVDNASTDNTSKIAKKYATKVYSQKNDPRLIDLQKNFGFEKATGDWILCLDADERITPELNEEIRGLLKNGESDTEGYYIPRKNIIFNKWIKHTGWYPDYQLRLFRREKGKFTKEHFHE
ncbi:MAG: glycosyltransferase family 2 protein, partial [Actinobacteria bacterium]|nr:glycosyltransferase family 2 protein [Actinomycetota bacterium]